MARSMASSPALMPSARRPSRKRGATTSRKIDDETASIRFEAVPHLEAHLPVIDEDEEDHAIVEPFAADAPGLCQAHGVVLEALAFERPEDGHDDLVAAPALPLTEFVLEPLAVGGVEGAGVIVDPMVGWRRDLERRPRGGRRAKHEGEEGKPAQAHRGPPAWPLELHLGHGLALRRRLEEGLLFEACHPGDDAAGGEPEPGVVIADGFV